MPEADGVGGGRGALDRVSLGGEALHDERRDAVLVLDHQDAHAGPLDGLTAVNPL